MAVKINRNAKMSGITGETNIPHPRFESAEAESFFARLAIQPDSVRKALYTSFCNTLVAQGIWTKVDAVWLFAADNANTALTNLVSASFSANSISMSFVDDQGFLGTGASYIDTMYNPTVSSIYLQNSAHLGIWSIVDKNENSTDFGVSGGNDAAIKSMWGDLTYRTYDNSATGSSLATGTSSGHFATSRGGGASYTVYLNGEVFGNPTIASTGKPNKRLYIAAINGTGAQEFSTRQYCAAHVGGALTDVEMGNLYQALRTYLKAVGALDTSSVKRAIADHPIADYVKNE